jgi:hypothetical protein
MFLGVEFMKLLKVVVLLVVLGGLAYVIAEYSGGSSESTSVSPPKQGKGDGPIGVEEKYGFTSQQVGQ